MAFNPDFRAWPSASGSTATAGALDAGLRAYMLRVFNWMVSGLVLTGGVAYAVIHTSLFNAFYHVAANGALQPTGLALLSMIAPLGFVLVLTFGVNKLSTTAAQGLFWAFCVAMGASMSTIFLQYTGESITRVFFITAATFAATSAYGYTTKADLTKFGSFLFMGLIGILIASVVNIFLGSSALMYGISVVGVLVFVGLTAFDTQRIKASYIESAYAIGTDAVAKRSVYDALSLYLDFINMFMFLLRLMGNRNSN